MAEDWAANVKKYMPGADDDIIAGIVRYCGIALHKRDSSLVSFTDPAETGRVRENFLKKKLGLTRPDADLDAAIAGVGEKMKGENFKNRVTVYYLLADHFGLLHLFDKSGKGAAAAPVKDESATGAAALGAAGAGLAGAGAPEAASLFETGKGAASPTTPAREPVASPVGDRSAATGSQALASDYGEGKGSMRWLLWVLLALILLALLWWLFHRSHEATPAATTAPMAETQAAAPAVTAPPADGTVDLATAPAEGSVTIPTGAGVTAETRDGKPVVKVYFDTGKTAVAESFGATAAGLKAWLASHAGSSLGVSGFNDKTGNAAANAALSKQRAEAVKAALVAGGIADSSVELVKPADTTDTTTDNASARRVEIVVR
jgi:outer membrane protein OmpA-like peptidoglycan-associated protein